MNCKYFLPFCGLSFHSLGNILWCTKVFNFEEVQFIFYFIAHAFAIISNYPLCKSKVINTYSCIVFQEFYGFISYIQVFHAFWVNFCMVWDQGSNLILLYVDIQLSQYHLLKRQLFFHWMVWHPCWKSIGHRCMVLFLDSQFYSINLYISLCFDYYSFVVRFEIGKCESSNFFFFF